MIDTSKSDPHGVLPGEIASLLACILTYLPEWVKNYWDFSRELGVIYEMDQIIHLQPRVKRIFQENVFIYFFLCQCLEHHRYFILGKRSGTGAPPS